MMAVKIDRAAQRGESDIMGEWFVSTYKPQPFFVVDNFHDASEDELQLENSERNSSCSSSARGARQWLTSWKDLGSFAPKA